MVCPGRDSNMENGAQILRESIPARDFLSFNAVAGSTELHAVRKFRLLTPGARLAFPSKFIAFI